MSDQADRLSVEHVKGADRWIFQFRANETDALLTEVARLAQVPDQPFNYHDAAWVFAEASRLAAKEART